MKADKVLSNRLLTPSSLVYADLQTGQWLRVFEGGGYCLAQHMADIWSRNGWCVCVALHGDLWRTFISKPADRNV